MKVIFSAKADEDLAAASTYISDALNNPIAAHNIIDKILRLSQQLAQFPELGANLKVIDALLDGYRHLIVDNYLIVYKIVGQQVLILRVLYAKSNYVRLLQG